MRLFLIDGRERPIYYRELQEALPAEYLVPKGSSTRVPDGVDLALVSDEFHPPWALLVRACRRIGIPTLHVPDGIVEWRNTWENPRSESQDHGMPLFQPVFCDKIACLGRGHARVLESLGNQGKCEIVGMPRLDYALQNRRSAGRDPAVFRLLVASARTPYFTGEQERNVLAALRDLKDQLSSPGGIAGRQVLVEWRLTGGLAQKLGLEAGTGEPLAEILDRVDAVISTPSTLMLEAMLRRLPVASIDYTNRPQYFHAAWNIAAANHIPEVLAELVRPSPARLLYQDTQLHDALECRTPATPRLAQLVREMARLGASRNNGEPTALPAHILPDPDRDLCPPGDAPDLSRLHPAHPVFARRDLVALQAELGQLYLQLSGSESAVTVLGARARALEDRLQRLELYGCGSLATRFVHTFPFPRRMYRAYRYWRAEREAAVAARQPAETNTPRAGGKAES